MNREDICLWYDGSWCYAYEYSNSIMQSLEIGEPEVLPFGSPEHIALLEKACGHKD